MKKPTQHQIIVKHLSDSLSVWVDEFRLRGLATPYGFIGDEAKKRCREFFPPEEYKATYQMDGNIYYLERRLEGKYAEIRVADIRLVPQGSIIIKDGLPTFIPPNQQAML